MITTVTKIDEAMPNHRFEVIPIERSGRTRWIASFVTSVSTPSLGVIRMLTAKPAATPA